MYRSGVSSTYRDDRASLHASLEALRRENEDLRTENLALRTLVEPAPARSSLAQLQGAFAATLVIVGALVGAGAVARESHAVAAPPALAARDFPMAVVPLPPSVPPTELRDEIVPRVLPATDEPESPPAPSPFAVRAALRPIEAALVRCLPHGDYRVRLRFDDAGTLATREISRRRGAPLPAVTRRCVDPALALVRSDVARELRYVLRLDDGGLRVRRARAR